MLVAWLKWQARWLHVDSSIATQEELLQDCSSLLLAEEFYAAQGIRVTTLNCSIAAAAWNSELHVELLYRRCGLEFRTTRTHWLGPTITDGHIDTRILTYARVYGRLTFCR